MVIPESERFAGLKDLLAQFVNVVAAIRDAYPRLAQEWPQFFLSLSYPWIVDETMLSDDKKNFLECRKQEIAELKFDGAAAKKKLEEVLATDKHLAECCPTLLHLANFLDSFFISATADAKRQGASQDRLDFAYSEFESLTYRQGRFKRISLSHPFNFDMEGNSATFAGDNVQANVRVERLDASTIPGILGESGFQALPGVAFASDRIGFEVAYTGCLHG
jgi:hypothetical protein